MSIYYNYPHKTVCGYHSLFMRAAWPKYKFFFLLKTLTIYRSLFNVPVSNHYTLIDLNVCYDMRFVHYSSCKCSSMYHIVRCLLLQCLCLYLVTATYLVTSDVTGGCCGFLEMLNYDFCVELPVVHI